MSIKKISSLLSSEPTNGFHIHFNRKFTCSFWTFLYVQHRCFMDIFLTFTGIVNVYVKLSVLSNISFTVFLGYFKHHITSPTGFDFRKQITHILI